MILGNFMQVLKACKIVYNIFQRTLTQNKPYNYWQTLYDSSNK